MTIDLVNEEVRLAPIQTNLGHGDDPSSLCSFTAEKQISWFDISYCIKLLKLADLSGGDSMILMQFCWDLLKGVDLEQLIKSQISALMSLCCQVFVVIGLC